MRLHPILTESTRPRPRRLVLHGRGCDCPGCRTAPPWWRRLAARFGRRRQTYALGPVVCALSESAPRPHEPLVPAPNTPAAAAA